MPTRTAVFDLDGTLADTSADLLAAANLCAGGSYLDLRRDAAVALRGGRAMLRLIRQRKGLDEDAEAIEAEFRRFIEIYSDALDNHTLLYDGVLPALDGLAGRGWTLAVCTNKPFALAQRLLEALGVRDRFASLLGADSLDVKKPDARHYVETVHQAGGAVARSFLVGDTETDMLTARNAGVACVMVGFAPGGIPDGHDGPVLDHFDELLHLVETSFAHLA